MDWIISEAESVTHVGDSYLASRPPRGKGSQEGCLLSVSIHPAAWSRIARLGGGTWTELSLSSGKPLRFVDFHESFDSHREAIISAGIQAGLIHEATFWQSFHCHEDSDDELVSFHHTREKAEKEEGVRGPEQTQEWDSTETLSLFWNGTTSQIGPIHTLSALVAYLAKDDASIHGVWWCDDYDPEGLSAPRGGVFQHRIRDLLHTIVPGHCEVED